MRILVTGGAGFVGSNLCDQLIANGHDVTILDNLSRRGVDRNLAWLKQIYPQSFHFIPGDTRDAATVRTAAKGTEAIFHLAAQVAVTTSVQDPRTDFEVNALGTLNVLEAARSLPNPPAVIFTSTNKVYGSLPGVKVVEEKTRYVAPDFPLGVPESMPLDFHSPYGCSKGAADQYVHDYGRIYDMPTIVFRMSCIYGPRQFGTEDQGWLAHFIIAAKTGRPITIYGNGKQVRDMLYVGDLVNAFRAAIDRSDKVAGQVFNIGGGPNNSISIWAELEEELARRFGRKFEVARSDWRPGDQPYYVSDIRHAQNELGWSPQVSTQEGIQRLFDWVSENAPLFAN